MVEKKIKTTTACITDKKLLSKWAEAVKERAGYKCEYPDCNINYKYLHAHHVFSRRGVSTRYLLDNGLCLCSSHHTMSADAAHSDPTFMARIIACGVRSDEWLDKLIIERRKVQKNTPEFRAECLEKLKPYLKD